jgi:hypothetical protein
LQHIENAIADAKYCAHYIQMASIFSDKYYRERIYEDLHALLALRTLSGYISPDLMNLFIMYYLNDTQAYCVSWWER